MSDTAVIQACMESWPRRPKITASATPYTQQDLEALIDEVMEMLPRTLKWMGVGDE